MIFLPIIKRWQECHTGDTTTLIISGEKQNYLACEHAQWYNKNRQRERERQGVCMCACVRQDYPSTTYPTHTHTPQNRNPSLPHGSILACSVVADAWSLHDRFRSDLDPNRPSPMSDVFRRRFVQRAVWLFRRIPISNRTPSRFSRTYQWMLLLNCHCNCPIRRSCSPMGIRDDSCASPRRKRMLPRLHSVMDWCFWKTENLLRLSSLCFKLKKKTSM